MDCGDCTGIPGIAHVFPVISPFGTHRCDNAGGCHFDWYVPGCGVHSPCGNLDPIDGPNATSAALDAVEGWEYDSVEGVIWGFDCGGVIVARIPLQQDEYGRLAAAIAGANWAYLGHQ
jgi:hypothetical protein